MVTVSIMTQIQIEAISEKGATAQKEAPAAKELRKQPLQKKPAAKATPKAAAEKKPAAKAAPKAAAEKQAEGSKLQQSNQLLKNQQPKLLPKPPQKKPAAAKRPAARSCDRENSKVIISKSQKIWHTRKEPVAQETVANQKAKDWV